MKYPDIDWYCDGCNCYLNNQPGFRDDLGYWICTECGYENSITDDNIWGDNYDPKEDFELDEENCEPYLDPDDED